MPGFLDSFMFGVSQELETFPTDVNLVAGPWVLSPWDKYGSNTPFLQRFNQPANANKFAYLYLFIAAGKMRNDAGIEDDNVGAPYALWRSVAGANYLRNNFGAIASEYTIAANQIAAIYGTTKPIALHFEPDFYQYNASTQNGGPISPTEMATAMNSWINSVKSVLPNAKIVIDISPWNSNLQAWHAPIQNVDFGGLVGKPFSPDGDGTNPPGIDGKSYAFISQQVGKPLILDDAHGPGGAYLPFDYEWGNATKRNARIADGVRAVLLPPNDNNTLNSYALATNPVISVNIATPTVTTSNLTTTGVQLNWNSIANSTAYEVQITFASDTNFNNSIITNYNVSPTNFTVSGLNPNNSYIYRVRARDNTPNYSGYATGGFTTNSNPAPTSTTVAKVYLYRTT